MSEKRLLALIGFLLGLLAGVLILVFAVDIGRSPDLTVEFLLDRLVRIIFGILILLGSLLIYRRSYSTGGIVNLVLGIVGLVIGAYSVGAILALLSGVLGLVASEARV